VQIHTQNPEFNTFFYADEWFKERLTFEEYVNEMKNALIKVHKRLQKKRHRWSRRLVDETMDTV
jgi:hypothetical protein